MQRARDRLLAVRNDSINDWESRGATTEADVKLSGELAKLWGAMCLTMPGITWIYNGDEIGMFGTKTNNTDGTTGHEDRWFRQPMKWSKEKGDDSSNCEYLIGFNNYKMEWDDNNQKLDGVGKRKKAALMEKFGTIDKIMRASERELAEAEGIGPELAARIRKYFEAL